MCQAEKIRNVRNVVLRLITRTSTRQLRQSYNLFKIVKPVVRNLRAKNFDWILFYIAGLSHLEYRATACWNGLVAGGTVIGGFKLPPISISLALCE